MVRAMSLGTKKIADAMIVPTLIITAWRRPSWRRRPVTVDAKVRQRVPPRHEVERGSGVRLENPVRVEVEAPANRRAQGARTIDADQPIEKTRSHPNRPQRARERQTIPGTGAPHVGEQSETRARERVRDLGAGAPERLAARDPAGVAAQSGRPAQEPA